MHSYYAEKLSAERLRACYDLAPPRTKAYLQAEIEFVLQKMSSSMAVLELGCGYGRVLLQLSSCCTGRAVWSGLIPRCKV